MEDEREDGQSEESQYNVKELPIMPPVEVGSYRGPVQGGQGGYLGWVGTRDWILYVGSDGILYVYNERNPETGAVSGGPVIISKG